MSLDLGRFSKMFFPTDIFLKFSIQLALRYLLIMEFALESPKMYMWFSLAVLEIKKKDCENSPNTISILKGGGEKFLVLH